MLTSDTSSSTRALSVLLLFKLSRGQLQVLELMSWCAGNAPYTMPVSVSCCLHVQAETSGLDVNGFSFSQPTGTKINCRAASFLFHEVGGPCLSNLAVALSACLNPWLKHRNIPKTCHASRPQPAVIHTWLTSRCIVNAVFRCQSLCGRGCSASVQAGTACGAVTFCVVSGLV